MEKQVTLIITFAIIYALEHKLPFFLDREERVGHSFKNITLGVINALIVALLFSTVLAWALSSDIARTIGLLHQFNIHPVVEYTLAILLFDLWMYVWHIINHKVPLLWRFHRVHHSDTQVDSTSAFRFHAGEIILSSLSRIIILPLLGISLEQALLYETLLLPFIMFHHSNINLSARADTLYKLLFVSPNMHRVHHSSKQVETDSNYSSIFSFWDRIFTTYRTRKNYKTIKLGLGIQEQKFGELMQWPFKK